LTAQRRVAALPCRENAKIRRSLGEKDEIRRGKSRKGRAGGLKRPASRRRETCKPRLESPLPLDFAPRFPAVHFR